MNNFLYNYQVKNFQVIDGDSITVDLDLGYNISIKQICRLSGIDTPELYGNVAGNLVKKVSDNWLKSRFIKNDLFTSSLQKDKYSGRYIGHLFDKNFDTLSTYLVFFGLAKPYYGKIRSWHDHELRSCEYNCNTILNDLDSDDQRQHRLSLICNLVDEETVCEWGNTYSPIIGAKPIDLFWQNRFDLIDKIIMNIN